MSMDYATAGLGAAAGLVVGFLISGMQGPGPEDLSRIASTAASEAGGEAASAVEASLSGLGDRVDAVSAAVEESAGATADRLEALGVEVSGLSDTASANGQAIAGVAETASANGAAISEAESALAERLGGLEERVAGLGGEIGAVGESSAGLGERMAALEAAVSGLGDRLAALETGTPMAAASGDGEAEAEAEAAEPEPVEEPIPGITPGMTEQLADGQLRVFLSGITENGQAARVAINGLSTTELRVGRSESLRVDEQPCSVTVEAIDRGHVLFAGSCAE